MKKGNNTTNRIIHPVRYSQHAMDVIIISNVSHSVVSGICRRQILPCRPVADRLSLLNSSRMCRNAAPDLMKESQVKRHKHAELKKSF
jgi:hypothetical protein